MAVNRRANGNVQGLALLTSFEVALRIRNVSIWKIPEISSKTLTFFEDAHGFMVVPECVPA
jgi:hypothetical protein